MTETRTRYPSVQAISAAIFLILLCGILIAGAEQTYIISAEAGPGGCITPAGDIPIQKGSSQVFAIQVDDGYIRESVIVDGKNLGGIELYSFNDVNSDHTIRATFLQKTGTLSIFSVPSGATVFVDGMASGQTPAYIGGIPEGTHPVSLMLDGYQPWNENLEIQFNKITNLPAVVLVPVTVPTTTVPTTTVPTTTSPTPIPTTVPTTTIPTTTKPTTIPTTTVPTTTKPTTIPTTTSPTPVPTTVPTTVSTTIPVTSFTPVPTTIVTTVPTTVIQKGAILVTSSPTGATIFIDGEEKGITNSIVQDIPVGTHDVTVKKTGYLSETRSVSVNENRVTNVPFIRMVPGTETSVPTTVPTGTITAQQTAVVTPAISATPDQGNITNTTGQPSDTGPKEPGISLIAGILVTIIAGGFCAGVLFYDLFYMKSPRYQVSAVKRAVSAIAYAIITFFLVNALIQAISSGLFPVLSPLSLPFILIFYLAISSIALIIGSVLSWPFRWTLRIHAVSGVMVLVTGLMALGEPSQITIFPLAVAMALSPLSSVLALWQERRLYSTDNNGTAASPDTNAASLSDSGGYDNDKTVLAQPSITDFLPQELSEKYSEISFIGMGGLARVYRATDNRSGEGVALKIPIHFNEATGRSFMKEIVAWEGLHHKNIVRVTEVNILPIPYVEMEYVDKTLTDLALPLDEKEAIRIVAGIAEGLAYAHSKGIIHRDIKPQNILLTADGTPKITDWGMSKILGTAVVPTITGFSLSYAAPEQVSPDGFGETDQRTDIYQLGTVFYELVTGTQLYGGDDIGKVSARIISELPPPPSLKNPAIKDLDRIILKCLEKRPENRYQSVTELLEDLSSLLCLRRNHDQYEIFED